MLVGARRSRSCCVALARPQIAGKRDVELRGLDLVVAVDVSKSMLVDDVGPTAAMIAKKRRDVAARPRARARGRADRRAADGDRIAPVVFAGARLALPAHRGSRGRRRSSCTTSARRICRRARTSPRCSAWRAACCGPISTTTSAARGSAGAATAAIRCPASRSIRRAASRAADDDARRRREDRARQGDRDLHRRRRCRRRGAARGRDRARARHRGVLRRRRHARTAASSTTIDPTATRRLADAQARRRPARSCTSQARRRRHDALAEAGGDARRYLIASARPARSIRGRSSTRSRRSTAASRRSRSTSSSDVFQPFLFAASCLLVIEAAIGTRRRREYPEEA